MSSSSMLYIIIPTILQYEIWYEMYVWENQLWFFSPYKTSDTLNAKWEGQNGAGAL